MASASWFAKLETVAKEGGCHGMRNRESGILLCGFRERHQEAVRVTSRTAPAPQGRRRAIGTCSTGLLAGPVRELVPPVVNLLG